MCVLGSSEQTGWVFFFFSYCKGCHFREKYKYKNVLFMLKSYTPVLAGHADTVFEFEASLVCSARYKPLLLHSESLSQQS